jgi:CRISPR/Cas system-associated protein Csx1
MMNDCPSAKAIVIKKINQDRFVIVIVLHCKSKKKKNGKTSLRKKFKSCENEN